MPFISFPDGGIPPALNGCIVIGGNPLSKVAVPELSVVVLESTAIAFLRPLMANALIWREGISEEFMSYLLNDINCYPNRGRKRT